jgi:predicted MPP superfamily phosphohydrolase
MTPMLDPRDGDIEDDVSSTKRRSLLSLMGSLLAEISFPKFAIAWMLLVGLPALLLGAAPILVSIWIASVVAKVASIFAEVLPALLLLPLLVFGWFAGRPLLRLAETSFWSLNALVVQPVYTALREGLQHLADRLLAARISEDRRASVRAGTAAASGVAMCGLGLGIVVLVWPASRWVGGLADLASPLRLLPAVLANSLAVISAYFAAAALIWGIADATMPKLRALRAYAGPAAGERKWRVAHLSDIHTVGERYGFRIESGRSGPRGNERLRQLLARLDDIHATHPLDVILITGDLTDAGRSAEWAEFLAALAAHPRLARLVVALPGNHDLNVVDRANPARMELPTSPTKRLRQLRTISALGLLQGTRLSRGGQQEPLHRQHPDRDVAATRRQHRDLRRQGIEAPVEIVGYAVGRDLSPGVATGNGQRAGNHRVELKCRDAFLVHQRAWPDIGGTGPRHQDRY